MGNSWAMVTISKFIRSSAKKSRKSGSANWTSCRNNGFYFYLKKGWVSSISTHFSSMGHRSLPFQTI